jgi:hypothetical protein
MPRSPLAGSTTGGCRPGQHGAREHSLHDVSTPPAWKPAQAEETVKHDRRIWPDLHHALAKALKRGVRNQGRRYSLLNDGEAEDEGAWNAATSPPST